MYPCDYAISWDGKLCNSCRSFFDDLRPRRAWWHSLSELRCCSQKCCKLCELTLAHLEENYQHRLKDLEDWTAILPAELLHEEGKDSYLLRVLLPYGDPRPHSKAFDVTKELDYDCIAIDLSLHVVPDLTEVQERTTTSPRTDSHETFQQISTWLERCNAHTACCTDELPVDSKLAAKALPTRLLQLTPGDDQPHVKIVATSYLSRTNIRYATLSHCWGTTLKLRLLGAVLDDYCSTVPWSSLPLTFQHAISAALRLNLRYLWIDALCIIQDDHDDWLREAARMVDVYRNSYLNFAATASENSDQGLFRTRNPACVQSFLVPAARASDQASGFLCYTDRWWTSIEHSPLAERAWTVQERFLAQRVVHFAADQVYWECNQLYTTESLPSTSSVEPGNWVTLWKPAYSLGIPSQQDSKMLYRLWQALQCSYAKASLTYVRDRPFAIAGLARLLCRLLDCSEEDYICGLWRPCIVSGLMWRAHGDWLAPVISSKLPFLPSWSWLSLCRGVFVGDDTQTATLTAEFLEASLLPFTDVFGAMKSARLWMRAPLCQVSLSKGNPPFYERARMLEVQSYGIQFRRSCLRADEHFELRLDDESDAGWIEASSMPVYLMLGRMLARSLSTTRPELLTSILDSNSQEFLMDSHSYECLILAATGIHGQFRRIGHVEFEPLVYLWSGLTDEQVDRQRSFARKVLLEDLTALTVPLHISQAPDESGMYVFTLV